MTYHRAEDNRSAARKTMDEIALELYSKTLTEMMPTEAGAVLRDVLDGKRPEFREASDLIEPVTVTPEPSTGFIWVR